MDSDSERTDGNGELEVRFIESKCEKEVEKTEWTVIVSGQMEMVKWK